MAQAIPEMYLQLYMYMHWPIIKNLENGVGPPKSNGTEIPSEKFPKIGVYFATLSSLLKILENAVPFVTEKCPGIKSRIFPRTESAPPPPPPKKKLSLICNLHINCSSSKLAVNKLNVLTSCKVVSTAIKCKHPGCVTIKLFLLHSVYIF